MAHEHRYTPRDRVLENTDPEVAAEYAELFKTTPAEWELYYSDGSMVAGTTQAEWDAAPDDDVQYLLWKEESGMLHFVYGSETYVMGGVVKQGRWMHDPSYFTLRDTIVATSRLFKGGP